MATLDRQSLVADGAIALDDQFSIVVRRLPIELQMPQIQQDQLWAMHPPDFAKILIHGRLVLTPRWQHAYGMDYHFAGQISQAAPVPGILLPYLDWVRREIDPRSNGILVNWYDSALNHYIGPHRDSTKSMCADAPIVTISFGARRIMRIRRWKGKERYEFEVTDGTVVVIPFETNLAWTHEVLRRKNDCGRRISVTVRAFESK